MLIGGVIQKTMVISSKIAFQMLISKAYWMIRRNNA